MSRWSDLFFEVSGGVTDRDGSRHIEKGNEKTSGFPPVSVLPSVNAPVDTSYDTSIPPVRWRTIQRDA
jgi:hypothetical protein